MDELFHILTESTTLPIVTSLVIGLLVAFNPCIFTTNVVVLGLLAREARSPREAFWRGVVYASGRLVMYTLLAWACIAALRRGVSVFGLESSISNYGEYVLVPVLIAFGLLLVFGNHLHLHVSDGEASRRGGKLKGWTKAFVLGLIFALAFCPVSAALYFGMLVPMSVIEGNGYAYPILFGLSSGLVVVAMSWTMSFGLSRLSGIARWMGSLRNRANLIVGILLIVAGILLGVHILIEH